MPSNRPIPCQLTPKALEDLDSIWQYTAEKFSLEQADAYIDELSHIFDIISSMPTIGRERLEFDPPVRIHTHQNHLMIYIITDESIRIVRIFGSHQSWQTILRASEP